MDNFNLVAGISSILSLLLAIYGSVEKVGVRASRSNDADLPGI